MMESMAAAVRFQIAIFFNMRVSNGKDPDADARPSL
jgi:hypothetical protein